MLNSDSVSDTAASSLCEPETPKHYSQRRFVNIDLIRCLAFFLLPSIHFFMYTEFYEQTMNTPLMYFMTGIRTLSMICIPLFIIITGYLMSKKEFGKGYFKGLIRILWIFFIYKIFVCLFSKFYLHNSTNVIDFIKNLSRNTEYTWYIGIYIWLYMLIPFLNIIYKKMNGKREKQGLLLASIGLIILPTFCNYYQASFPDIFSQFYPIAYYFIGAYIREYNNKDKKWKYFTLFLISLIASTILNILVSYNNKFSWNIMNDWRGFENAAMGTFLFIFLCKLDLSRIPKKAEYVLKKIAELSFGAYLCSWIADSIFYPKFKELVPDIPERMKYYLIMVPLIIVTSLILSAIANIIYKLTYKCSTAACVRSKEVFYNIRQNKSSAANEIPDVFSSYEPSNGNDPGSSTETIASDNDIGISYSDNPAEKINADNEAN